MKILFITDLYPVKQDEKTTPKTLFHFVKEWEKFGHQVDVIKPNFILNSFLRGKPFYKTGKYENVYNVNYWTPFLGKITYKFKKIAPTLLLPHGGGSNFDLSIRKSEIQEGADEYDLIIAHMPSGILFADKLGLPFVAGVHNSDLEVLSNPLYKFHFRKRLEKALYNAKAISCRSFVIKEKLLKLYPDFKNKTFVAPSGIDENVINSPTFQPFNPSAIKILTCANLIKRKNIDKLILACKNLKNTELTVVGDGKLRKELEKLDKNVIYTGWLEQEKVYQKMKESDIFILPSVNETFGMVYLEAMSQGCITVCTRNDGIAGIIKDGENGFLTESSIEDIKNTILKIRNLSLEDLNKIKQNAFETIKRYTSEKVAENYLQQILKIS